MFHIEKKENNDELTVSLQGRLDTTTAPELETFINENYHNQKELILDLQNLEYISSAGLRVILLSQKKTNSAKASMKLVHVNDEVYEVLEVTGFTGMLNIEK